MLRRSDASQPVMGWTHPDGIDVPSVVVKNHLKESVHGTG